MITRNLIACGILLACGPHALANGGGYYRGGVQNTGDIAGFEPKATENIRILDEKLTVLLGPKEADVEVRYLMKNVTDKKVKVSFGFPVEESFDEDFMASPADGATKEAKQIQYCKDYRIAAGGKPLTSKWKAETKPNPDKRFKGLAGWLISEVSFDANQELPMLIRFQSAYPESAWSISDNETVSAASFKYRLSTAACWAGTIESGRVELIPNGIHPDDLKLIKPVNRFKKQGTRWIWEFRDLEPTLADDFEAECRPAVETYYARTPDGGHADGDDKKRVDFVNRGKKWSMLHSNYQVTASSTLKPENETTYDAAHLKELRSENAWSEGAAGPGVGEWLEIVPELPKPLSEILIKPGYQKGDLFQANPRPKKVKVELNGKHTFVASVADLKEEVSIPVTGYDEPVRKIRMTFTEVYPGSKYEDLCVTSIRLHAILNKKPNLGPTR